MNCFWVLAWVTIGPEWPGHDEQHNESSQYHQHGWLCWVPAWEEVEDKVWIVCESQQVPAICDAVASITAAYLNHYPSLLQWFMSSIDASIKSAKCCNTTHKNPLRITWEQNRALLEAYADSGSNINVWHNLWHWGNFSSWNDMIHVIIDAHLLAYRLIAGYKRLQLWHCGVDHFSTSFHFQQTWGPKWCRVQWETPTSYQCQPIRTLQWIIMFYVLLSHWYMVI